MYNIWKKTLKCECGALKVWGGKCPESFHSDWCPVYSKQESTKEKEEVEEGCNCGAKNGWSHYSSCPKCP
jgi:hypothetical protein